MSSSKIPSPARSQGVISTPRRNKPRRRTQSSPAHKFPIRLSTLVSDSFKLSPMPKRRSVLTDDTNIEVEPVRKSWWKKLGENSREVMDVLESNDIAEIKNVADEFDVEVLSQEKRNYTSDLPESSDGESISSIVIPQRKLFTQKDYNKEKKFAQIINNRDNQSKRKSHNEPEKDINVPPKKLFNQPKPRNKPVFPSGLLNISANKTLNKTKEMPVPEVKGQMRTLFGNRPATKRKNMFANFIVSDSEDDIPEIQPKVFGFNKNTEEKRGESSTQAPHQSPRSSIDLELDEWKKLASSTLIGNQLEDTTPVKRARLTKLSRVKESEAVSNINKTKKSSNAKNKSKISSNSKLKDLETSQAHDVEVNEEPNLSNSRLTRNKSKSIRETSLLRTNKSKTHNTSKITTLEDSATKGTETSKNEDEMQNTEEYVDSEANNEQVRKSTEKNQEEDADDDFTLEYDNDEEHNIENNISAIERNDKNDTVTELNNETKNKEQQLTRKTMNQSRNKNMSLNRSRKDINQDLIDGNTTRKTIQPSNEEAQKVVGEIENQNTDQMEGLENVGDNTNVSKQITTNSTKKLNKTLNTLNVAVNKSGNITAEGQENQSSAGDKNAIEKDNENETEENIEVNDTELSEQHESNIEAPEDIEDAQDESQEESQQIESEQEQNETDVQNDTEEKDDIEVDDAEEQNDTLDDDDDENDSNEVQQHKQESEEEQESERHETPANKIEEDQVQLDESEAQDDEEISNEEQQNESCNMDEIENEDAVDNNDEENESEVEENEETENNDEENESEVEENEETENNDDEENESEVEENEEIENNDEENEDEEVDYDDQNGEQNETVNQGNTDNEIVNDDGKLPNSTSKRDGNVDKVTSPEAILHDKTNQLDSFAAEGRNTSIRKTKSVLIKNLNVRSSLAPVRESIGFDGTANSSAENSGWDSHRTTRKTLRQTFGKDFTLRKSLRALVMEKSGKRQTNVVEKVDITEVDNTKVPQANSTEFPHFDSYEEPEPMQVEETMEESDEHEISQQTRQTTLEMYLQKLKGENLERKRKMEEQVRNSIKSTPYNPFKVPRKPTRWFKPEKTRQKPTKTVIPMDMLPPEILEDMKYKPPKRFQPNNASWITKRLYKFLETKLEPKYDYKARVRAEKLVENIFNFTKELKKYNIAPSHSVDLLKNEMARLDIVKTHFDFYEFFHGFMPREVRIKVVPDVVNKISLPKHGVFADIIR